MGTNPHGRGHGAPGSTQLVLLAAIAALARASGAIGPLEGRAKPPKRPDWEREWMIVDSLCRQHLWGDWKGGSYVEGKSEAPGMDPTWPVRSQIEQTCPQLQPPVW